MSYLALAMVVRAEPSAAAQEVKRALGAAGAVITSAQRLGNQALVFGFEIAGDQLGELRAALGAIGSLLDDAQRELERGERTLRGEAEVLGTLHISLVHGAPDERVELPKVPG